jgi:O-antigen/teichoic acid export membrane protein
MASVERQLFANQLWETVGFVAKAGFMLGLTPLMVRQWGSQGYGEFALASSVFVLLSLTDLGIRARTRLALCRAVGKPRAESGYVFRQGVMTFAVIGSLTIGACFLLSSVGVESRLFRFPPAHRYLLFDTASLSIAVMLSGILLEPLVAAGEIGSLKCATALGWLTAIPATAAVLWNHGSVLLAVAAWLGCLLGANILTLVAHASSYRGLVLPFGTVTGFCAILRDSFWFNLCNASWAAKTYGTTLLLSAIYGPSTAGFFFILLRLSEIISMLGAISCDVLLGELAQGHSIAARQLSFRSTYRYAVVLCTHLAVITGFCAGDIYRLWVPGSPSLPVYAGAIVALLGLTSALNRKTIYAAMGLGAVRIAALCGVLEAVLFLVLAGLLPSSVAFIDRLGLASLAAVALWPVVQRINRELNTSFRQLWLRPLLSVLPFAGASTLGLAATFSTESIIAKVGGVCLAGLLLLLNAASLYRKTKTARTTVTDSPTTLNSSFLLPVIPSTINHS